MSTADDALNCCQATTALLNQLITALASLQDEINALQARMKALEDSIKGQDTPNFTPKYLTLAPDWFKDVTDQIKAIPNSFTAMDFIPEQPEGGGP